MTPAQARVLLQHIDNATASTLAPDKWHEFLDAMTALTELATRDWMDDLRSELEGTAA